MEYKKEEIKEYFDDFINENKEYLEENYPTTWLDDLHHYAFNEDYYIIGTYKAKLWLGDMAFDVIEHIKEYETFNFGEVTTDFSNPERIVNMYVYIIGEEIVSDYVNQLEEVA
tara:strand:+ start:1325 stop:1663 length:339 start_codon:yes stop_codon:yes gene_type:complete